MNNEMLYQLFLNSLLTAKTMLSDSDYEKLLEFIKLERDRQNKS